VAKLSVDKALLKAKSHAKKGEIEEDVDVVSNLRDASDV